MNGYIKCGISINGIICQQQKKWSVDTCYNIDESWKHYAKWGGSQLKRTTYYMITFIWDVWNMQICRDRKQIFGCPGLEGWEDQGKMPKVC